MEGVGWVEGVGKKPGRVIPSNRTVSISYGYKIQ